jgi:Holliday junction resolvase
MFRTNRPATAKAFCDRTKELEQLQRLVAALQRGEPHWVAIIGPRKVGKTSLILEFERYAPARVAFVVLDAENQRPLSWELFRTYALRAADALLRPHLSASLEVLAALGEAYVDAILTSETVRNLPPELLRVLRALPDHAMDQPFVRQCLDLPEQLAHHLDRYVVVSFDEFQQLSTDWSLRRSDPLPVLRSAWQRHQRVAYVVSGSGRTMLEEMVTHRHSPFFQHFSLLHLDRFSEDDAVRLLVRGSPPEGPIPPGLAQMAVRAVGGHPYYLQLLGEQITLRPPPYDERTLKESLQELLFARSGRLALYFQNTYDRLVGHSSFLAAVLDGLAEGPARVTDIARALKLRVGDTARYLERLGDAVRKEADGRYRLEDEVFGLWLAWRRPGGSVVPMSLVGDQAEREVASRLARLGFELIYQSRASRGAFDLLALRGPHQLAIQVKGSGLPIRFSRTSWNRMVADAETFGWNWVIAAVSPEGQVSFHDPTQARQGREYRVTAESYIENVAQWLHRQGR